MNRGRLFSIGSINVDLQVRIERFPADGEAVVGTDFLLAGGGKGANVACMARRLGADVALLGRVGNDLLRELALKGLEATGVDLGLVARTDRAATGVAMVTVFPDGHKGIVVAGNANEGWEEQDLRRAGDAVAEAPDGSIVVADLEAAPEAVERVFAAARERGLATILDPSPAGRVTGDLLAAATFVTPNTAEAETLTGIAVRRVEDAFRAADVLLRRGVQTAIVRLGGGGCVLVNGEQRLFVPTVPTKAVDTTGAGDAFAGALGVALMEGQPPERAARMAVAAATIAVTRYGAQPSYPTRQEVEHLVARL